MKYLYSTNMQLDSSTLAPTRAHHSFDGTSRILYRIKEMTIRRMKSADDSLLTMNSRPGGGEGGLRAMLIRQNYSQKFCIVLRSDFLTSFQSTNHPPQQQHQRSSEITTAIGKGDTFSIYLFKSPTRWRCDAYFWYNNWVCVCSVWYAQTNKILDKQMLSDGKVRGGDNDTGAADFNRNCRSLPRSAPFSAPLIAQLLCIVSSKPLSSAVTPLPLYCLAPPMIVHIATASHQHNNRTDIVP